MKVVCKFIFIILVIQYAYHNFFWYVTLLQTNPAMLVDMFEQQAVPYGLVRYGVAPDHPEVKNCISSFSSLAQSGRCNFYGNVKVGSDISIKELQMLYDAIILVSCILFNSQEQCLIQMFHFGTMSYFYFLQFLFFTMSCFGQRDNILSL